MTDAERQMARDLHRCTFCPGIGTKRFAREMAARADQPDAKPLTEKQAKYLREAVIRYRRQIPAGTVKLAMNSGTTPP